MASFHVRYTHLLKTYLLPQWKQATILLLLLLGSIALSLFNPLVMRLFLDEAQGGQNIQALTNIALIFFIVAIVRQIVTIVEGYIAENVALTTTNHLRADLMLHCLKLSLSFHGEHTPGEMIERIDGDVSALGNFFSRFLLALLGNVVLMVGVLVLSFLLDVRIGAVLTLFAIVSVIVVDRLRNVGGSLWERVRQSSADFFSFVEERLGGTEDIRASGAVAYMVQGLAERSFAWLRASQRAIRMNSFIWNIIGIMMSLGTSAALIVSIYLYYGHLFSVGLIYVVFSYTDMLRRPIEQIGHQLRDLQQASGSIIRIQRLLDEDSTIQDGPGVELPDQALAVTFNDVHFAYEEGVRVLKNLSFEVEPGKVLGLLGRTGSGKTTCSKLLTRLYDPDQGSICLNGIDLRQLRLADLYQHVGLVTQDVQVLHTSVRNNITLFDPSIDDQRIISTLDLLGLGNWLETLSDGLDTKLVPGATGLSAGEAQLLSFARVFLKNPGLIILDEASSRLDPATESRLEQAIDTLLAGRTAIIIAHHLTTVQRADNILILNQGQCEEYGPRLELARSTTSRFAQLLHTGLEEVMA